MKLVNSELLDSLSSEAQQSERQRKNYNFHERMDDPLQRMLNAFEPNSYVQPHCHLNPDKREVFLILRGRLLVVVFSNMGKIKDYVILDSSKGLFATEIAGGEWHTVVGLDSGTVAYEIKDGPYSKKDDKNFAQWAPSENDPASKKYLASLLSQISI